jgi:hypothetical protein
MFLRAWQALRALLGCQRYAPLGLLVAVLVCGCNGGLKPPQTAEVSGKVLFNGQPVPGGEVTFVAIKGGYASGGAIDENGNYKVTVPVGEVKITVDNRKLQKARGAPKAGPMLKNPDAPAPSEMKGKYISLPTKYANADKTDLTYTVVLGSQTHEITLN